MLRSTAEGTTGTWPGPPRSLGTPRSPRSPSERWRYDELIGRGGQAEVWKARDLELSRDVAIKRFAPDLPWHHRRRLRREVEIGQRLRHPNLVQVYELIELEDGRFGLAMELLSRNVESSVQGPVKIDMVIMVAEQVLSALAFLHARNIVHRDVKPSNLLVRNEGQVCLADLGLALPLDDSQQVTQSAALIGTPAYMSPEQLQGDRATCASDLYGLGATLLHLLTGRPPRAGRPVPDDIGKLRPDCPAWLARFVSRLLEHRPEDRWPTAGDALRAFTRRRGLFSPRRWRRWAAMAILVAALGAVAGLLLLRTRPHPASVQLAGNQMVVNDKKGDELWSRSYEQPIRSAVVANLVGGPASEVSVAVGTNDEQGEIQVFSPDGSLRARFEPLERYTWPWFFEVTPGAVVPRLATADLDGDTGNELLWLANHPTWYPGMVGIWEARRQQSPRILLLNSGHMNEVTVFDIDNDGDDELVLTAANNPIGYQRVVVVLDRVPDPETGNALVGVSPDLLRTWRGQRTGDGSAVLAYVPLGSLDVVDAVTASRHGLQVQIDGASEQRDLWGNRRDSPSYGHDRHSRLRLWDEIGELCLAIERNQPGTEQKLQLLERDHAQLLTEDPMQLAMVMLVSRSMAQSNHHGAAVAVLANAARRHSSSAALRLLLATCQVISGAPQAASETWRQVMAMPEVKGPNRQAALIDLATVNTWFGDQTVWEETFRLYEQNRGGPVTELVSRDLEAARAFCQGRWSDPALDEGTTSGVRPETVVLRAWANLERGAASGSFVEEPDLKRWQANPEIGPLATLLKARMLQLAGEQERACSVAEQGLQRLVRLGRLEVRYGIWIPLAETLLTACPDETRATVRPTGWQAPGCWFGTEP